MTPPVTQLCPDERGRASLDGVWEFYPGDHQREALDDLVSQPIAVPALWEAQGHLHLDGVAWYRLRFGVAQVGGRWTLRFGAVMDSAEVYLNGRLLGRHEHAFTPFEVAATSALVAGENILDVRVTDPPVGGREHVGSPHGKQGWANEVFPSPPSLYLTYGGIWQPVTLRRHGDVAITDVFVDGDPDDLTVTIELLNQSAQAAVADAGLRTLGCVHEACVELAPEETRTLRVGLGATTAAGWQPDAPVLHEAHFDVRVGGVLSDQRSVRFGLRTVRLDGTRLMVNGVPYRMKSALVQGFRAGELYAEGSRQHIVEEVRAAQAMGFSMLRLHIKAFDPVYLDVCDELGMLVHCDLPIAEPIAHAELGGATPLGRRCVEAVTDQVRRDRNHPSVVLWSAMNELGLEGEGVRASAGYEQFARTLYAAVTAADPTRPVIENDWIEPDPARVFCSPILTAHWYGRLHAEYLDKLEEDAKASAGTGRPVFVTEFGDWGLPDMPALADPPFWDYRETYSSGLAATPWPDTLERFTRETQRYQGLSDRLQIEVFRRHEHIGGYCLTELTDVPQELNGVLDLHRRPKCLAVEEIARANQVVLPMLALDSFVVPVGGVIEAPVTVANDGPPLGDVEVELSLASAVSRVRVGDLPGHRVTAAGRATVGVPEVAGGHELRLTLRSAGTVVSGNRYPVHVVALPGAPYDVQLLGAGDTAAALQAVGATVGGRGPAVVAEGGLDSATGERAAAELAGGGTVLVLAQTASAVRWFPLPVELAAIETAWGSSVFAFTTDSGVLPSLPRRTLLVAEESTVQARDLIIGIGSAAFPTEPVVAAYKPVPGALSGTVVGMQRVGSGRLLLCQYRLAARARAGDPMARALLADLVRWAAAPRPPTVAERVRKDDGRSLTYYSYQGGR